MTASQIKLLLGSLICFTATVLVGEALPSGLQRYFPSYKQHGRLSARNIINPGIGYSHGYTTVESFLAPNPTAHTLIPFLDLRGHVFNDGIMAANAGLGLRKSVNCMVYGLNVYYDYRNTPKMHYNQIGCGAEVLDPLCDFRINAYLPIKQKITAPYNTAFAGFTGHYMLLSQDYQFAMKGFNAELGLHAGKTKSLEFYAAAGPYYFTEKNGPHFWGGKIRLTCKFQDYFTIELSNSYDHYFRNRFQCQFTFNLPFGGNEQINTQSNCDRPRLLASRMIQPVERQEIIVQAHKKQNNIAIDPTTHDPYYFVFVDNTSNSSGTYESPYPTLTLAQDNSKAGDIIYVYPGNGTTRGMDSGITLKLNQKFWGSGIAHALPTTQGNITIPAQSEATPNITYLDAVLSNPVIALDSINEVSGFNITNATYEGIIGNIAKSITISNCTIDGSDNIFASDQIHLEYSDTTGSAVLNNLTISNSAYNGIYLDATTTEVTAAISNCTFQNNGVYPISCACTNQANVSITKNIMEDNANGYALSFSGPTTLQISENNFNGTTSISSLPIEITANSNAISTTIENNNVSNNTCGGIHFAFYNTSSAQLNINNNTITNNDSGAEDLRGSAIVIDLNNTSVDSCNLSLTNNTITHNSRNAFVCSNGAFNDFQMTANNNTITDNGRGGFSLDTACGSLNLTAENNIISDGGGDGIATSYDIFIDTANIFINNNQITGNTDGANGISLPHSNTNLNMTVTNNNISDNDSSAILAYAAYSIENMNVNITNNIINNNQNSGSNAASGIDLEQFANFTGVIENNTFTGNNNSFPDVFIGSAETTPVVCLELSGNSSENGYTLENDTGTFNLAPCDVNAVNTGSITLRGTIASVQSCPEAATCPI